MEKSGKKSLHLSHFASPLRRSRFLHSHYCDNPQALLIVHNQELVYPSSPRDSVTEAARNVFWRYPQRVVRVLEVDVPVWKMRERK